MLSLDRFDPGDLAPRLLHPAQTFVLAHSPMPGQGIPREFFPTSPVIGFANPVARPVVVEGVDGELHGTAFFDYQYEGPPTCVHGGVIAMVFDEMLGAANILGGEPRNDRDTHHPLPQAHAPAHAPPSQRRAFWAVTDARSERGGRSTTTR